MKHWYELKTWQKLYRVSGLIVMAVVLIITVSPRIYTPPVLTPSKLAIYKRCIKFIIEHNTYTEIRFNMYGYLNVDGYFFMLKRKWENMDKNAMRKLFSPDEILEIEQICDGLRKTKTIYAYRTKNVVLFQPFVIFIRPVSPGIVYSLDGENPNQIDDTKLDVCKPFVRIKDDWYMSRKLVVRWHRNEPYAPVPKSIIDLSMNVKNLAF